ncbi:DotU family type IV/VI secretion system protein [Variovorax sp.]|uniref:DotU family type IV/VI secretion system protein n=1 Tax=Variovorax sp. TaxID=1871043 RepID=UPI002D2896F6|nr:DotU family type IV/VI secretion system protein [Variovorax sp.]HYP84248.1 DotU family type IV/VI secretion system protein [Variovorax sp.]
MTRLLDFFSPLIEHGLMLAGQPARADPPANAAQRERAFVLLDQARAAAAAAGYPGPAIESASFAMAAWVDEILSRAAGHDVPGADTPVQQRLFNSGNARTEFFHHLSGLQPQDDELREVYWTALALGFAGQYYFEDGDRGELGKLKALHGRQLRTPPLAPHDDARLTPQPYEVPDPARPGQALLRERRVLTSGALLALLMPVLALGWLLLAGHGEARPSLAQRVDAQLQHLPCADLNVQAEGGLVRVGGFVSRPQDMQAVRREVQDVPGVSAARFDLGLRPWPHCEVHAILKPYQARNQAKGYGLRISAPSARDGRLREGDPVVLRVRQAAFDGNFWVDYYTADGSVLHLLAGRPRQALAAGQQLDLGQDIPASWLVSPPFGTVMVTVLASPSPIAGTEDRPPFELASAYLQRLREMLAAQRGDDRLAADIIELDTVERQ